MNKEVANRLAAQSETVQKTIPSLQEYYSRRMGGNIIPIIKKRAREGKESEVFIDEKQVEPKRVKTAMSRYSSRVDPEFETVDGFTGM